MKFREIKINLTVRLTDEDIEDIVVTALEGGIGYWACLDNTSKEYEKAPEDEPVSITATKILLNGGTIRFFDEEDDDRPLDMDINDLREGIQKWIEGGESVTVDSDGRLDLCDLDALGADCIFQNALLGEVVYG